MGEPPVRATDADSPRRAARQQSRRARHSRSVRLGQLLLALPWVTLVLVALVATVGAGVLRQDVFSATSVVTAPSGEALDDAAADLLEESASGRVEERIELGERWRGSVSLNVERPYEPVLLVRAQAHDPRLAALAADTAAALVVDARGEDGLELSEPAPVPTGPVERPGGWLWWVTGAAALALAVVVERKHGRGVDGRARGAVP